MKKFKKLSYKELKVKKIDDFETAFTIKPVERGFAITLGNALRRVLISTITGVSSFSVKIKDITHEFESLKNVHEDVVQIILNLRAIKFRYNEEIFADNEIIVVSLQDTKDGKIFAKDLILPPGVEIVNKDAYIATIVKNNALELELFLTSGRGYISFEENKNFIKIVTPKMETNIKNGTFIAVDSNFSPIVNVSYEMKELNTSATLIQEQLQINIKTDGTVSARDALHWAGYILTSHLAILNTDPEFESEGIFADEIDDEKNVVKSTLISSLDLSVRSYNCLRRAGFTTVDELQTFSRTDLGNIKNLGKKSIEEIVEKFREHGVNFDQGVN